MPQKRWSDFFPGFLEGVLLDELSYCSQQRFPSIKIIQHRIPDQNINMSIFSCLLVIHLAWLAGIHSSDFMVRNLWLPPKKTIKFSFACFRARIGCGVLGVYMVVWHWNLSCTLASTHLNGLIQASHHPWGVMKQPKIYGPQLVPDVPREGTSQGTQSSNNFLEKYRQVLLEEIQNTVCQRKISRDLTHKVTNMHTNKSEDVTDKDAKTLLLRSTGQSCALMSLSLTSSGPIFTLHSHQRDPKKYDKTMMLHVVRKKQAAATPTFPTSRLLSPPHFLRKDHPPPRRDLIAFNAASTALARSSRLELVQEHWQHRVPVMKRLSHPNGAMFLFISHRKTKRVFLVLQRNPPIGWCEFEKCISKLGWSFLRKANRWSVKADRPNITLYKLNFQRFVPKFCLVLMLIHRVCDHCPFFVFLLYSKGGGYTWQTTDKPCKRTSWYFWKTRIWAPMCLGF